jgi:recombination protein RecT
MLSDPGKSIAYYAVVTMADGEKVFDVMSRDQVDAIKKRSKAVQGGKPTPWDTDYEEMAKKTVFKRLAKLLPLSPDVAIAFSADETTKNTISPNIAEDIDVTDWSLSDAEPASQPLADATGKTPEPETKPPIQPLPSVSPVDTGTQGKPFSPRLKLATQSQLDKLSQLFLDCRMTPETQASFVAEYGNGVSRATDMSLMSAEALLDHLKGLAKGFMGNEKQ